MSPEIFCVRYAGHRVASSFSRISVTDQAIFSRRWTSSTRSVITSTTSERWDEDSESAQSASFYNDLDCYGNLLIQSTPHLRTWRDEGYSIPRCDASPMLFHGVIKEAIWMRTQPVEGAEGVSQSNFSDQSSLIPIRQLRSDGRFSWSRQDLKQNPQFRVHATAAFPSATLLHYTPF